MADMSRATTHIDYAHLTRLAGIMAQHVGLSEATISTKIVGHARLFSRLRSGAGCTAYTYRDALVWFFDNWPLDLEWPVEIPVPYLAARPVRQEEGSHDDA